MEKFQISVLARIILSCRGICGASQWSAARETARRAGKLDEEGLEVVVCRHRELLKALNMNRGKYLPIHCSCRRSSKQPQTDSSTAQILLASIGPTLRSCQSPCWTQTFTADEIVPFCHAKTHSTKCEVLHILHHLKLYLYYLNNTLYMIII